MDNAKFGASQSYASTGGGVTTFNGRSGPVFPQSGDYTAEMVGAIVPRLNASSEILPFGTARAN